LPIRRFQRARRSWSAKSAFARAPSSAILEATMSFVDEEGA
jgi:hypothetical protein